MNLWMGSSCQSKKNQSINKPVDLNKAREFVSSEVRFQCIVRLARRRALDAKVFGALFERPPLGLGELVRASCVIVVSRVVIGGVVIVVVLHGAEVIHQPGCRRVVRLVPAVAAVGGRVPLHSAPPLRSPVSREAFRSPVSRVPLRSPVSRVPLQSPISRVPLRSPVSRVPLLPPLRGGVSQEVAVLRGSVVGPAAPGEGQGIPVVVVDGGALGGRGLHDSPGGPRRVLEEPALVELALGRDGEEAAVIALPLRCAVPVRPAVHRLGPPAVGRRGPLARRRAVEGAAAPPPTPPVQGGAAARELPPPELRGGGGGLLPRAVFPQSLQEFGDAALRLGLLDFAAPALLVAAVVRRRPSGGALTVIVIPGVMMVGVKLPASVVHLIGPVPVSAALSLLLA